MDPAGRGEVASSTQGDTAGLGALVLRTQRLGHTAGQLKGQSIIHAAGLIVYFRFLTSKRTWES